MLSIIYIYKSILIQPKFIVIFSYEAASHILRLNVIKYRIFGQAHFEIVNQHLLT